MLSLSVHKLEPIQKAKSLTETNAKNNKLTLNPSLQLKSRSDSNLDAEKNVSIIKTKKNPKNPLILIKFFAKLTSTGEKNTQPNSEKRFHVDMQYLNHRNSLIKNQESVEAMKKAVGYYIQKLHDRGPSLQNLKIISNKLSEMTKNLDLTRCKTKKIKQSYEFRTLVISLVCFSLFYRRHCFVFQKS